MEFAGLVGKKDGIVDQGFAYTVIQALKKDPNFADDMDPRVVASIMPFIDTNQAKEIFPTDRLAGDISSADPATFQMALHAAGFSDTGPKDKPHQVDGIIGPRTTASAIAFLKENPDMADKIDPGIIYKMSLYASSADMKEIFGEERFTKATTIDAESAKGMLDMIQRTELGHFYDPHNKENNYNIVYGGGRVPLTSMTINEVIAYQIENNPPGLATVAAGAYQVIRPTLAYARDALGLTGNERFDMAMQDRIGAFLLLDKAGLQAFLNGSMSEEQAMQRLSMEWASFPKDLNGASYYASDGLNKALIKPDVVLAALRQFKEEGLHPNDPGKPETPLSKAHRIASTNEDPTKIGPLAGDGEPTQTQTADVGSPSKLDGAKATYTFQKAAAPQTGSRDGPAPALNRDPT